MPRLVPLGRFLPVALLTSLAVAFVLVDASQAQTDKGKKHALLVGVRSYDHAALSPLQYTENDVEELATTLTDGGFASVHVLTTTRGEKNKAALPTVANLRAALKALLAKKSRDDTVLVALAGHGISGTIKEAGKEKDESFFCPSDAQLNDTDTLIGLSQLFHDLGDCGAAVKLLLVDACRNDPKKGRNVDIDALPKPPRGTAALFSCSSGERAFETEKLGKGHGVFFHHVLQGLRGKARNERGEVTWARLTEHVTESVSEDVPRIIGSGAKQTPELKVNLTGKSPILIGPQELTNSIGMKLVRIPAGKFTMGSTKAEQDDAIADWEKKNKCKASETILAWYRSEGPRHEVEITKPFYLGICEVTQKQYQKLMGKNPSYFSADGGGKDKVKGLDTDDFPVERVSWEEAVELCKKLSALPAEKRAGRKYRLPTEAEWEYSCRGGASSTTFHFGNSLSSTQANFDGNYPFGGADKGKYLERTEKVGCYKPNGFGLHDMHGNVNEWCADWYGEDYYTKGERKDPKGPASGSDRVLRGGGWDRIGQSCRSAHRGRLAPDSRYDFLGFRVAQVPSQDK